MFLSGNKGEGPGNRGGRFIRETCLHHAQRGGEQGNREEGEVSVIRRYFVISKGCANQYVFQKNYCTTLFLLAESRKLVKPGRQSTGRLCGFARAVPLNNGIRQCAIAHMCGFALLRASYGIMPSCGIVTPLLMSAGSLSLKPPPRALTRFTVVTSLCPFTCKALRWLVRAAVWVFTT